MPRFVVTAEMDTRAAEQAAEGLWAKLRRGYQSVQESANISGARAGLNAQGKAVRQVSDELDGLRTRLKLAQADMAQLGVELNDKGASATLRAELEGIRAEAVRAQSALRELGDDREAAAYTQVLRGANRELETMTKLQRGAASRAAGKAMLFDDRDAAAAKNAAQAARQVNQDMTLMEANRKRGVGTLEQYRQKLREIEAQQLKLAEDAKNSPALRGLSAQNANRAGTLISQADQREAARLEGAITRINALLAQEKMTAAQAAESLAHLAVRAEELARAQGVAVESGTRYVAVAEKLRQRAGALTPDSDVAAALRQASALRQATTEYRGGVLQVERYRAALNQAAAEARKQATNTLLSAAAQREYARVAEQSVIAIRRLNAEQLNLSTGGSAPFALNTIAFGAGAIGASGGLFIEDALRLNEEAKQAALTLEATAKFHKQNIKDALSAAGQAADETRQDATTTQQAMANLLRKTFTPEMAREAIVAFSDAATAAGMDATKAIIGASEAILSEQSRQLNSAGIAENLGPALTDMTRALKDGEAAFRANFLQTDKARDYFDTLREGGKSFQEAAKGATLWQFVIKAAAPVAGRTAAATDTLTGSLNNFGVQYRTFKREAVEGISIAAVPALNTLAAALKFFNDAPAFVKSSLGIAAAIAAVGISVVALGAGYSALILQARKLMGEESIRAGLMAQQARLYTILNAQIVMHTRAQVQSAIASNAAGGATQRLTTALAANTGATAINGATQIRQIGILGGLSAAIYGTSGALITATKASKAFILTWLATPIGAITAGIAAVGAVAYKLSSDISATYDAIEKADKEFWEGVKEKNGEEYAGKLNRLMTQLEIRGDALRAVQGASSPEEAAAAKARLHRIDAAIAATRKEMAAIQEANRLKKGDATATTEQAEAYNQLKTQLDGVAERFGDMKLTAFQRDLRSLRQEYERAVTEIDKLSTPDENGVRKITEAQEKLLRAQNELLIPQGTAGLVEREMRAAKDKALEVRAQMQREEAALMQDGIAQRRALLAQERQEVQRSYQNALRDLRANRADQALNPFVAGITPEEKERRLAAQRDLNAREEALIREQTDRVKLLERQAAADIVKIRQQRADAILEAQRGQMEAELGLARAGLAALEAAREQRVGGAVTEQGRLDAERAYQGQVLALTRDTIEREAGIRRGELQVQLDRELRAAQELGEQKGQAEALAREKYRVSMEANEREANLRLTQARLDGEKRVQDARAAVVDKAVERELRGIEKVEGARLAALQREYQRRVKLAQSQGDTATAQAYQRGVDEITEEATSRARDAADAAREARTGFQALEASLTSLTGKAEKGLKGAREAARKPFADYIEGVKKEQADLIKARDSLIAPDPQVTARLNAEIAKRGTLIVQATAEQARAVQNVTNKFHQEERDKAVQQAAKLAELRYDKGEGDRDLYLAALKTEEIYWTARLRGLEEGSAEYAQAQARLEQIGQDARGARLTLPNEPLVKSLRDLADAQVEYLTASGRSEAQITQALRDRVALIRAQVADQQTLVDQAVAAGEKQSVVNGLEAEKLRLMGQQVQVERQLAARPGEEAARQLGLYRQVAQARLDASAAADDERAQAGLALELAQRELALAHEKVKAAQTQREQEEALAALRTAEAGVETAQRNAVRAQSAEVARQADIYRELAQARFAAGRLAGTGEAEAALNTDLAQRAVDAAQERLNIAEQQGLTDKEVLDARNELELAGLNLLVAQRKEQQAIVDGAERRLSLARQTAEANLAGSFSAGDEEAEAALNASFARRELEIAQQRLEIAETRQQVEEATAEVAQAMSKVVVAEREAAMAGVKVQERVLTTVRAQLRERLVLAGLSRDGVAQAEQALAVAQEEARLAEERLSAARTQVDIEEARGALAEANAAAEEARVAVLRAQNEEQAKMLSLIERQTKALLVTTGGAKDPVLTKMAELEITRMQGAELQRQLAQAREMRLTHLEIAELQVQQTENAAQARQQQEELNRALRDEARLYSDLATATTRSQLARSRFFNDGVALARVELAATREKLRLNRQELSDADKLGLSDAERLGLRKEQVDLLAEEAQRVRDLAQAERDRMVFARALRDTLAGVRAAARDQGERTAVSRSVEDATLSFQKLREAEEDAAGFIARMNESADTLELVTGWLRKGSQTAADTATVMEYLNDKGLSFDEAQEGKARLEALSGAIQDYRAKLAGVADAYDRQIGGIEALVDATVRLSEVGRDQGSPFGAEVNAVRREQALQETDRLLRNEAATYEQLSAAAGRLAETETQRLAIGRNLLRNLADRAKAGDRDALETLRQRLISVGVGGKELTSILQRARKEGAAAVEGVTLRMSEAAEDRLASLQRRAMDQLTSVERLRAESFRVRAESARAFEQYASLNRASLLADAGFTDLEAQQIDALDRQKRLEELFAKTSFIGAAGMKAAEVRNALRAENAELLQQVAARKGLSDLSRVTRADMEEQREINKAITLEEEKQAAARVKALTVAGEKVAKGAEAKKLLEAETEALKEQIAARTGVDKDKITNGQLEEQRRINEAITLELEKQRALQAAALLPYRSAAVFNKDTARLLEQQNDALAAQVANRLRIRQADVTRAQIDEQRELNKIAAQYNTLQEARLRAMQRAQQNGGIAPEVYAAILIDRAVEDDRYSGSRLRRALEFEKYKANAVADIYAQAIGKAISGAIAAALGGAKVTGAAEKVGTTTGEAVKQAVGGYTPAVSSSQASAVGSGIGQSMVVNNRAMTVNVGGFTINTQPGQSVDPRVLAQEVVGIINRSVEVYGECP